MMMRVNARFEGVAEQQVEYLAKTMDLSVSDVLRVSVDHYYRQVRGEQPQLRHFGKHVGAHRSGRSDISENYKAALGEALAAKHLRK